MDRMNAALTLKMDPSIVPVVLSTFRGHRLSVTALAILPDGRLVSGSDDKTIKIWSLPSGECETLENGTRVSSLVVLPDERLAVGNMHSTINLWDIKT